MKILWYSNADFGVKNMCGETPLHYAAEKGKKKRSTENDPSGMRLVARVHPHEKRIFKSSEYQRI